MMIFILPLLCYFFIINKLNVKIQQIFYQMFLFIMLEMLIILKPLNMFNIWGNIYLFMGVDFYSFGLLLLSYWIMILMMLSSNKVFFDKNYIFYMNLINFMMLLLVLCFISMNLFMFYIFFECSLIPVFLMILGWGYQVERIEAGYYLMLYTMFGSMPLLLVIINLFYSEFSLFMDILKINYLNIFIYYGLIMAFLIKMPMYFVHVWLPKAHVEAPIMGSMILAGVMLKLGSYGLLRVMNIMLYMSIKFNMYIIITSLIGGVYSSFICLCQVDMKLLVAYSSVSHMSILLSGLMTMFNFGYTGSYMMMLAHGLCSPGLFCLVNINYERLGSRSLIVNKGLINLFSSFSIMWFLLFSSNLSFPPSLNLFSEIMLINSLIIYSKLLIFILMMYMFFSASYSLYIYSYSQHGKMKLQYMYKPIFMMEYMLILLHWIPLNITFLNMFWYMN